MVQLLISSQSDIIFYRKIMHDLIKFSIAISHNFHREIACNRSKLSIEIVITISVNFLIKIAHESSKFFIANFHRKFSHDCGKFSIESMQTSFLKDIAHDVVFFVNLLIIEVSFHDILLSMIGSFLRMIEVSFQNWRKFYRKIGHDRSVFSKGNLLMIEANFCRKIPHNHI